MDIYLSKILYLFFEPKAGGAEGQGPVIFSAIQTSHFGIPHNLTVRGSCKH